jgi:nucleoid-associated protein YgaU
VKSLKKATISVRDPDKKDKVIKDIEVLFNPEKYTVEKSANWKEKGKKKRLQFRGIARKSFSIDLFFDTFEMGEDVRSYTDEIVELIEPLPKKNTPPVCVFSWGGFIFRGIIEKVTQNFTLFSGDGIPVRAVLNVSFKQFSLPDEDARGNPPGDPTQVRVVKEGETLNLIASQEYGDPALWRIIADKNKIQKPRFLKAGMKLVIPALE